jgi:hypothetical protein
MTEHKIKVHPQFWDALCSGDKRFELRRNDRAYKVGDKLTLCYYDPSYGHSGKERMALVTYVLMPEDCPGLMPGYCILGIGPVL